MSRTYQRDTPLGQRMELLGYSQVEVSSGAGIDRWYLNDYLFDRKPISPLHLLRLCAFLKCEPETLRPSPAAPRSVP